MTEVLFKVLAEDGRPHHGGKGAWPLPNGKPGKWLKVDGDLVPCSNGLHLCRPGDLVSWLGPTVWLAEAGKERIEQADKVVVRRARLLSRCEAWNDRTARLFAADCAERVLTLFERERPDDSRPRDAIAAARAFANDEIDAGARAAAGAAAWAAARAAAWDAAGAAAWAAAWDAAWDAARAAARDAAGAAAWDAARAAARDAEREWQTARLMEYLGIVKGAA